MILYNVTVNIDTSVHEDWLEWMQQTHIPDVMATGLFVRHQLCRLLTEIDNGGITYAVQYFANSMEDLELYNHRFAPALQEEHSNRYNGKFVAFRTTLEVIEPVK